VALTNLGATLFYLERFAEAARVFGDAVALDEHNSTAWLNLGRAPITTLRAARPPARRSSVRFELPRPSVRSIRATPRCSPRSRPKLHARPGAARARLRRARARARSGEPDVRALAGSVFEAWATASRPDQLGAALAAAIALEIERDPDLAGLRADPRYTQLNPKA